MKKIFTLVLCLCVFVGLAFTGCSKTNDVVGTTNYQDFFQGTWKAPDGSTSFAKLVVSGNSFTITVFDNDGVTVLDGPFNYTFSATESSITVYDPTGVAAPITTPYTKVSSTQFILIGPSPEYNQTFTKQ